MVFVVGTQSMRSRAEPGFARAQPTWQPARAMVRKEGAHGGTMGSPVQSA